MADETLLNPPLQATKLRIDDSRLIARIPKITTAGVFVDFVMVQIDLVDVPSGQFKTNMISGIKQLCQNRGLIT